MDAIKIWQNALEYLEKKVAAVSFEVWIKNLRPYAITGSALVLSSALQNNKKVIESTYKEEIRAALKSANSAITDFVVVLEEDLPQLEAFELEKAEPQEQPYSGSEDILLFNKSYTFDDFVIGGSNQIAYAAAKSVAESPGGEHNNPLFIYGGVGLGKTHIMQAIGNHILNLAPKTKILYIPSTRFVEDFMDSLKDGGAAAKKFRQKYRQTPDVLMIDDIQFLENKGASQEAMFNTFNDLYQHGKQIVFTADRHPKELKGINERLLSRFQCGLTVDITKPDLETRIHILKRKSMKRKFPLEASIIEFIAEKVDSNIRELEGALSKVIFYAGLSDKRADDLELVKEALKDFLDPPGELSMDSITDAVANYFKTAKSELIGKKKSKNVAEPRQVAIYIINDVLSPPLTSIGDFFGGRDHTTIMYARDKISSAIENNPAFARKINDLKNIILKV